MKKVRNRERNGFTLIELLIVIAIIGILAGVLIAVIDPAQQRLKANQAVMRSLVSKACLVATSCISSSSTAYCVVPGGTFAGLGISLTNDTPPGSIYVLNVVAGNNRIINFTGTMGTCIARCTPTVVGTSPVVLLGTCLIQ